MAMGGVGEAMLLGAAMGGGSAALMGRDPLKGALMGGLTGGAGAGISGALAGGAEGAALASGTGGAGAGAGAAGTTAATGATGAGIDTLAAQNMAANPSLYPAGAAAPNTATMFTPSGQSYAIPSAGSNVVPPASATPQTFSEGAAKFARDPIASMKANMGTAAGSALAGISATRPDAYVPPEYKMKGLRWSDNYMPAYAEGGITNLAAGGYDRMVGEQPMYQALARGGISSLGSYSDGGRMLKGPGDGMSDSIPANISGKRPARLADGEFVVPADVVSHLGNGSTDAGAKQLYAMMDKVRQARTGRKAQGREINARKFVPA